MGKLLFKMVGALVRDIAEVVVEEAQVAAEAAAKYVDKSFDEYVKGKKRKNVSKPIDVTSSFGFHCKVVGVTYGDRQERIKNGLKVNNTIYLERERQNSEDGNAIKVLNERHCQIGYIPKEIAKELAYYMDKGRIFHCYVEEITGGGDLYYGVKIHVKQESLEITKRRAERDATFLEEEERLARAEAMQAKLERLNYNAQEAGLDYYYTEQDLEYPDEYYGCDDDF